ncbi:GNAT family N-acetyltransferase [Sphaerotilus microaerophilus]|uniref:Acetyltransferase n=1 Tax=Sphaerotilus microaerophilus TaxID=2914710 RepID=A0ABM7YIP7_9BURK|nr:GNAT family N-acetyltransferase [Sphaerotilus sp. FB-5]BDI04214.1 acetyltransferase [Sphaerotilus sp. FB-5]
MSRPTQRDGTQRDGTHALASRAEDAGLNAAATADSIWLDGWLLRFCDAKAKRSRCINALAPGRLPLPERLALAQARYAAHGLPLFVRITPFVPPGLDEGLAALGLGRIDDTRVMLQPRLASLGPPAALPAELELQPLDGAAYAELIGQWRGTPAAQRQAHATRLTQSPVRYEARVLRRRDDAQVLAAGQWACEAEFVGLYDVAVTPASRGQGLGRRLCEHLLAQAREAGARIGYLQVEADNSPARQLYARLGFSDAYAYHYRTAAGAG